MTKCDLIIELEEGRQQFFAGDVIRGTLTVRANEDIKCDALYVRHKWATHGKGNVTSGEGIPANLFSGKFNSGDHQKYDFTINTLDWPPTYHGHYLNVDHFIEACVSIPWAFDVKQTQSITLLASQLLSQNDGDSKDNAATAATPSKPILMGLGFGCLLFLVIFVFLVPALILVAPIILAIFGAIWFFGSYLPKKKLGKVECRVDRKKIRLGEVLTGNLHVHPNKAVQINGISVTITAREECISGSGSNRKTHTHRLLETVIPLADGGVLTPGPKDYPFSIPFPADGPPTMELPDNNIKWDFLLRVDIPKWPDFKHAEKLTVQMATMADRKTEFDTVKVTATSVKSEDKVADETNISFAETANFLLAAQGDHEQIDTLIEAVLGLEFTLSVIIERFVLYAGVEDRNYSYPQGRTAFAEDAQSDLLLTLYFPPASGQAIDLQEKQAWSGQAKIVGYDFQHGRLRLKVMA